MKTLTIRKISETIQMAGCAKATENSCGIAYRFG